MLRPIEKALVLLKCVGLDNLETVLTRLKSGDAAKLRGMVEKMEDIPGDKKRAALLEIFGHMDTPALPGRTSPDMEKANRYLQMMEEEEEEPEEEEVDLISFLHRADHKQLIELIKSEHPQVIAVIVSFLPPEISCQIIPLLQPDVQADVAYRIATMGAPHKDMLRHLSTMLGKKVKVLTSRSRQVGGVESLVKIMRGAGRNAERIILEHFLEKRPELASEIKNLMLVFEDLVLISDINIQKVLKDVDTKTLAKALKKTTPEIRDVFMRNLSERARQVLQEDLDSLGRIPMKEVEKAQQYIVEVLRRLEEKGEITISKEKEELV
jgi:flagellar motor switch protein FliG